MADSQLYNYKETQKESDGKGELTLSNGGPVGTHLNSLTVGRRGPVLLQDLVLVEELAHFDRERIPERVVHAKGAGAYGFFEVTNDEITKYCKAKLFEKVGKKTEVFVRFSTVGGELGSADTARDPRGFAVKFYTEQGNWDLVGNNTPIFFLRDPVFFPSFIHSQKRNPRTHLKDANMFWDFISLRPETTHQVSFLFSDRGTPDGYRHMNGYGSHTFKLVNDKGEAVYCKFHLKTGQGIKNLMADEADRLAGSNPDYAIEDLYNAIASGQHPSWSFYIQVMTFDEAEKHEFNPFDLTKVWSHKQFPLIPVGKMTLNRNPDNYFNEVEQAAFAPAHLVPGIEPSPDKMLQARLFSYPDTQRHRLGANYMQLPVNCPHAARARTYHRDGPMQMGGAGVEGPNYYPNSFNGPDETGQTVEQVHRVKPADDVARYNSADEDNFTQVGIFFSQTLNEAERNRLMANIAGHMANCKDETIRRRALANFTKAHADFGAGIGKLLDQHFNK